MKTILIQSAKLNIVFRAGELPSIDPRDPRFLLRLGQHSIEVEISAKSARKLAVHPGPGILQGRLVSADGRLMLLEAGFQFPEVKPADPTPA
jgi:hypothetical protein